MALDNLCKHVSESKYSRKYLTQITNLCKEVKEIERENVVAIEEKVRRINRVKEEINDKTASSYLEQVLVYLKVYSNPSYR